MTQKLTVYRDGDELYNLDIDESTVYSNTIMGVDKIAAVFNESTPLDIREGDYVAFRSNTYEVNQPISVTKTAKNNYEHTVNFESFIYRLYNKVFMHLDQIEFVYVGTATQFVQLICDQMNTIDSGWSVGTVDSTDDLTIQFFAGEEGYTCRTALTYIAEKFGMEYKVVGKSISLVKTLGVDTNLKFEQGRSKGLYSLTMRPLDDFKSINRLRPFGSTKNIPSDYRGGQKRLTIEGGYIERTLYEGELRKEGSIVLDDIFPQRTAPITTVAEDMLSFTDDSLFDINGQRLGENPVMIVMQSGALMGEEFTVATYDHDTKTVYIEAVTLQNGAVLPSETFPIEAGDLYTITGIKMPQMYIDQAEAKLLARANDVLNQPVNPTYDLSIDEKFMRDNGIILNTGDRVNIRDESMGIDAMIRVTGVEFPICNPDKISATISDVVPYSTPERLVKENNSTKTEVKVVNRLNAELARRNMQNFRYLWNTAFDPDNYLDPDRIKPFSIETYMLSVGAKSQNFGLNEVVITPNYGGDPSRMDVSAGELIHYELSIDGLGYTWALTGASFTSLDPNKHYYLYAECSKTILTGEWKLSETPIPSEDPSMPGVWNFNLGILYPVSNGYRDFDFTNGITTIVGDNITTGRIKSLDGLNFFDLTQNKFKLGGASSGIDWNVTTPSTLTIKGSVVQSRGGATDYIGVFIGDYNPSTTYYRGDIVKYDGSWYKWVNPSIDGLSGIVPTNTTYWRLNADKGDKGDIGDPGSKGASLVYRGNYNAGLTYYGTDNRVDAVYYSGMYYVAKPTAGSFSGILPTNTSYWDTFGAQFDSIATGLLLAERAFIGNLVAQYIETAPAGNNRVIINEYLEALNSSGVGTGVFYQQHNIALFSASNAKINEISRTGSAGLGVFFLEFPTTNDPGYTRLRTGGVIRDWSAYNTGSYDSRISAQGNFTLGFPRFLYDFYREERATGLNHPGSVYRYFFQYEQAGFNAGDPNADYTFVPNTSIGRDKSAVRNMFLHGAYGSGNSRNIFLDGFQQLDGGGFELDRELIFTGSSAATFDIPRFLTGASPTRLFNVTGMQYTRYGRELTFLNRGSGTLTIRAALDSGENLFLDEEWNDVATLTLRPNEYMRIKVISKNSVPSAIGNWRWAVIEHVKDREPTMLFVGSGTNNLPANPYDGQLVYVINRDSATYTLSPNGKTVVRYNGTQETTGFNFGNHAKKTYIYSASNDKWYELY